MEQSASFCLLLLVINLDAKNREDGKSNKDEHQKECDREAFSCLLEEL